MFQPTVLDLFCGAGGISHGFAQAGFSVVAGVDWDHDSLMTFKSNHTGARVLGADLAKAVPQRIGELLDIAPGSIDCITGGPPCQGFSRNRAFRHHGGQFVDDPRNHLYWHFFEYVAYFRPKIVVLENVPELLIKANGYFRNAVFERFQRLGYHAEAQVLNAAEFGVPQRRRRAFFLAGRDGHRIGFPDPITRPGKRPGRRTPTSPDYIGANAETASKLPLIKQMPAGPCVWDAISDLQGEYADSLDGQCKYATEARTSYQCERRGEATQVRNHFPWKLSERQLQRIRHLREGQGQLHLPKELQTRQGYGSAYRRLQSGAQALTITTWMFHPGSGMFTHPTEDRVITIREAARLQSFQDVFVFFGRYHSQCRQLGNAVAPLVARAIAQAALSALGYERAQDSRPVLAAV